MRGIAEAAPQRSQRGQIRGASMRWVASALLAAGACAPPASAPPPAPVPAHLVDLDAARASVLREALWKEPPTNFGCVEVDPRVLSEPPAIDSVRRTPSAFTKPSRGLRRHLAGLVVRPLSACRTATLVDVALAVRLGPLVRMPQGGFAADIVIGPDERRMAKQRTTLRSCVARPTDTGWDASCRVSFES